ncbi:RipA family octameric membrane protein [Streptomyces rubrogriseus]
MPAYAYSKAEWAALGEGRELPLTHVEQWVPLIFAFAHVVAFCGLVV